MQRAWRQGECGSGSWPVFPGKPSAVKPPSFHQCLVTRETSPDHGEGWNDPEHRIGFWRKGPTSSLFVAHLGLLSEFRVE